MQSLHALCHDDAVDYATTTPAYSSTSTHYSPAVGALPPQCPPSNVKTQSLLSGALSLNVNSVHSQFHPSSSPSLFSLLRWFTMGHRVQQEFVTSDAPTLFVQSDAALFPTQRCPSLFSSRSRAFFESTPRVKPPCRHLTVSFTAITLGRLTDVLRRSRPPHIVQQRGCSDGRDCTHPIQVPDAAEINLEEKSPHERMAQPTKYKCYKLREPTTASNR
ncbi:hypothetical protein H257_12864 [Aphanomyces astaci]|uniref:Uncharacterized protein n=1 Tax=Aphanomyces astaci TaxID=112090 RepID=W4FZ84_APHAT|nr:hypothetical protein H257_12864 [Aphanomyces astaci]ETV72074.1 hypothetical protein H257_12864 [Aphanomyces astaci]|eukprot:XP_009838517.1 hypothetical protein H257_12864 [Aphanomyces astaci]